MAIEDPARSPAAPPGGMAARGMIALVIFLFFARGFSTALLYALIPRLKSLFALSYTGAMLTQLCFFLGYLVFSLPAAMILARLGYIRAILFGLMVMIAGCLVFALAAGANLYSGFLAALFVVAAGIIFLQVATNPFVATLGPGAAGRLTLAQAFNSLGTTIAPLVGAWLILGPTGLSPLYATVHFAEARTLEIPFLAVAAALSVAALLFWMNRAYPTAGTGRPDSGLLSGLALLRQRRFLFSTLSIFVYVGAEVSVGSIMVSYLAEPSVLGISVSRAAALLSLYWGGAMCGRFLGAALLRTVPPHRALIACAGAAGGLAVLSSCATGTLAAVAILSIGVFNSIMFPTIFLSGIEGLGARTPQGSGVLCMAISGGAVIPMLAGMVADGWGLASALLVPAACYLWISFYGAYIGRRPALCVA